MRKIVLALFLALAAFTAGLNQAAAMEGFDLGDMPPLPPPLLDDSPNPPPLAPPAGGSLSPLVQGGSSTSAGLTPIAPPPGATPAVPPISADVGGMDFSTPLPIAPPPAAVGAGAPAGGTFAPPPGIQQAVILPGELGASTLPAASAQSPAIPETPRPGRIDGGRVNVRAGPNTQYESIAVLTSGAPVTVLAKHDEWYKIVFPADQLASIHKNMVTADITGEIPETGLPGVVNQDNAPVHAFYWDKSTVVGTLPRGTPVIIKQERGQWYRIEAPENARAYVFARYVRLDGGSPEVAVDTAPAPENPAVDLTAAVDKDGKSKPVKLSKDQEKVLEIKESYYKRLREQFEAEQEAEEMAARAAAEARKLQATQLDSALKDLDSRLAAIDQEKSQRINYITREFMPQQTMIASVGAASWAPPDPAGGGYTGWVENIGRVGGAPTPFRLTKGGEIRFYLVSDQFNLNEFVNRRVWLNGRVEYAGGASASVLNIEQIRILTELEIAEGMRQPQGGGFGAGQPDPYGQSYGGGAYGLGAEYGAVAEFGPGGVPAQGTAAMIDSYGGGYAAPSGPDPFSGYGSDYTPGGGYGQGFGGGETFSSYGTGGIYNDAGYGSGGAYVPSGREPGTADLVTDVGAIYGSSSAPSYGGYDSYGAQTTYQTYTSDPSGYGMSYDSGTSLPIPAGGSFQSAPFDSYGAQYNSYQQYPPAGAPQGGGISPSDPSQLPDVVGGSSMYYGAATATEIGGGMTVGEVETDRYERPAINEIAP